METDTQKIVFFGTPEIAVPTLQALATGKLRPIAVVTEPDQPAGRGHRLTPPLVKQAAEALRIPVVQPRDAAALLATVKELQPTLGVVVAYGRLLRPAVLAIPRYGFVNLHFSLLPKYRGAAPIQTALLHGDTTTGVTLMQLDVGLDTGPLLGSITEPIYPDDTTGMLGERLAEAAGLLALDILPSYLAGAVQPIPQAPTLDPVTRKLTKTDGEINWTQSPEFLVRFIRAMQPWPGAWTIVTDTRFLVHKAHVANGRLVIDTIQAAGKRSISGSEFARGYPAALTALAATGTVAAQY